LAVAGRPEAARIFDAHSGRLIAQLRHGPTSDSESFTAHYQNSSTVYALDFSADGRWIATAGHDGTARIWNVEHKCSEALRLIHSQWVHSVAFHPTSRYLLTGCQNGDARIFEVSSGKLLAVLANGNGNEVFDASFCNSGEWVITATQSGVNRIWDWRTSSLVAPPVQNLSGREMLHAAVNGSGTRVAIAGFSDAGVLMKIDEMARLPTSSPQQYLLRCELVASQRLSESGVEPLTPEDWIERYNMLRNTVPIQSE